jgi:hypothetical protein
MIAEFKLIVRQIEAELASFLAFETRAASLPFKEGCKGLSQVQKGLIRSILGDLPGPGELLAPHFVKLLLEL